MRLSCPACGFHGDVDAFLAERDELDALAAALALPAVLAAPIIQYLRLFRPAKRAMTAKRVGTLLAELAPWVKDARVERHGRTWAAPLVNWQLALDEILAKRDAGKLQLPLKSHGYLLEIVVGLAAKSEAKAEAKDGDRRGGRTPVGTHISHVPVRPAPELPPRDLEAATEGLKAAKAALRKESTC